MRYPREKCRLELPNAISDVSLMASTPEPHQMQGRSVLRSVTCDLGFPRAEMSESIRDNPNRRLSHAGVAIGDFALDSRPSSRGRQAVRFGDGVALLDLGDGRRRQLLPANA